MITHGDLVNLILLDVSPMGLAWANHTGGLKVDNRFVRYGLDGSSDILLCRLPYGQLIGIEAKIGKDPQRENQKKFARALTNAGGLYILARSTDGTGDDARAHVLRTLKESAWPPK